LEVDDLDAEMSRLKARGAKIHLEIMDTPVCRFAMICDPDGNKIMIHKRKS
jgi:predicted enzyme related to lactoylglutathione lyase